MVHALTASSLEFCPPVRTGDVHLIISDILAVLVSGNFCHSWKSDNLTFLAFLKYESLYVLTEYPMRTRNLSSINDDRIIIDTRSLQLSLVCKYSDTQPRRALVYVYEPNDVHRTTKICFSSTKYILCLRARLSTWPPPPPPDFCTSLPHPAWVILRVLILEGSLLLKSSKASFLSYKSSYKGSYKSNYKCSYKGSYKCRYKSNYKCNLDTSGFRDNEL